MPRAQVPLPKALAIGLSTLWCSVNFPDPPSAYTSAMFSETRYAMNGNVRVAYRASPPGARDIVLVPAWFSNCEDFPELPSWGDAAHLESGHAVERGDPGNMGTL